MKPRHYLAAFVGLVVFGVVAWLLYRHLRASAEVTAAVASAAAGATIHRIVASREHQQEVLVTLDEAVAAEQDARQQPVEPVPNSTWDNKDALPPP